MGQQPFPTRGGFPPAAPAGLGVDAGTGGATVSAMRGVIPAALLRGRPVRSAPTGEELGRVSQVLLDLSRRAIAGVRLRHGGLLDRRWRVAAFDDLVAVTPSALLLPDRVALREDVRAPAVVVAHRWTPLVRAADAWPLGRVRDVRCDLHTGRIEALCLRPGTGRTAAPRWRAGPAGAGGPSVWLPAHLVARWGPAVLVLSIDGDTALRLAASSLEHEV